ncbi:MAG: DUF805 domain-containing protein [Terrimicrobiaceae bacterium]|nr:DUF805 domain-containing protein [Terrimicrobiaceae bacterium]
MNYYIDAWKNYVNVQGRARRKAYWMFVLFNFLITIVANIIDGVLGTGGLLSGIYLLAVLLPSIALAVRRLHDIGKSGWWLLIGLVPLVGAIVLLVFAVLDSQPGENAYGPNPKGA